MTVLKESEHTESFDSRRSQTRIKYKWRCKQDRDPPTDFRLHSFESEFVLCQMIDTQRCLTTRNYRTNLRRVCGTSAQVY